MISQLYHDFPLSTFALGINLTKFGTGFNIIKY